jgi:glycosyltransferase involved in cell wall biosynthesis
VKPTDRPFEAARAPDRPLRIGCLAEFANDEWRWIADDLGPPLVDWTFFSTRARGPLEGTIKKPALRRYRACRELATGATSGDFDLIVTHQPPVTCWTEIFSRGRRKCPHVAFAFNFTVLPTGPRLVFMRRAFATLDRLVVFSTFEKRLYSDYFRIPATRIDMIPWRIRDPRAPSHPAGDPSAQSDECGAEPLDAICAVGSQGRDYGTLLEAMRQLPHIRLILVAGAENLRGLDPPPNVDVRQDIPLADAEAVIRRSRFLVVPLWDSQTACGHVTIIYSMFHARAIVATESAGLADYIFPGRNGIYVRPKDPRALAAAIDDLWNRPDEARRLGEAGREFALMHCLESQTVDYVRRLVEQLRSTGKIELPPAS